MKIQSCNCSLMLGDLGSENTNSSCRWKTGAQTWAVKIPQLQVSLSHVHINSCGSVQMNSFATQKSFWNKQKHKFELSNMCHSSSNNIYFHCVPQKSRCRRQFADRSISHNTSIIASNIKSPKPLKTEPADIHGMILLFN